MSKKSLFSHSVSCTGVGKVKGKALRANIGFRAQVLGGGTLVPSKGKASGSQLVAEAQVQGLGGVTIKPSVMYRAKRLIEREQSAVFEEKFAALPKYLHDIVQANKRDGSFSKKITDENGIFRMAFLCLAPAVDLIRICGRGVSGIDFRHSKNGDFEGV